MTDSDTMDPINWYSDETATFGDRLAGAREAMGLSQQELAAHLGVKPRTITDWENDLNDPRANKLQILAGALNVSMTWLLTGEGNGLQSPDNHVPANVEDTLAQMRNLRAQMNELTHQMGVLENRLRLALRS